MRSLVADILVSLFLPWRMVQRLPEQAGFCFFGRHTLSGLLLYPAIIGAFLLLASPGSDGPEALQGIAGEGLPAPQAGLMITLAKGIVSEATPVSEWLPRFLISMTGWLITGVVAGFIAAGMITGLLVMVLLAGGQSESVTLSSIWRLSSMSTLFLPVGLFGLASWAFVYADYVTGTKGSGSVKLALALAATCWATVAFWVIAWTTQRRYPSSSRFRTAVVAVVFSIACWLVVLMGSFVVTQPLQCLGIWPFKSAETTLSMVLDEHKRSM